MAFDMPAQVNAVFESFPGQAQDMLLAIRDTIFTVAEEEEVGPLTEALRWGEPAYLTETSKAGSTVRLGWKAKDPDAVFVFYICTTNLIARMRDCCDDTLDFQGNRAIRLALKEPYDAQALRLCLRMALTYKRDKT